MSLTQTSAIVYGVMDSNKVHWIMMEQISLPRFCQNREGLLVTDSGYGAYLELGSSDKEPRLSHSVLKRELFGYSVTDRKAGFCFFLWMELSDK